MKKSRQRNNGITLIALVVTIIVLLILAAVSIATLTGENGILTRANDAKTNTEVAEEKEKVELSATGALAEGLGGEIDIDKLRTELGKYFENGKYDVQEGTNEDGTEGYIVTITENDQNGRKYFVDKNGNVTEYTVKEPEEVPEVSDEPAFSRENGVIEIEFLSGTSYNITETPNHPILKSEMTGVTYNETTGKSIDVSNSNGTDWYSYEDTSIEGKENKSKWANAKVTKDGVDSYFVWIPRYAYRIIYFDTEPHENEYRAGTLTEEKALENGYIVGYSDARGLVDEEGKTPSDMQEPVTSIGVGEKKLRTHPAFETDLSQGGWSNKLEGIWVAKYEVSQSGTTIKSVSGERYYEGGFSSSRWIGPMYDLAYAYDREKESHLMKNSEWGAMAYLTESKYGRNGTGVSVNLTTYTAGGNGATPVTNKLQSTTGNEYGIFDTAGGAYDYVAGYIADSSTRAGNSFASTDNTSNNKTESTQYATVYQMATSNSLTDNYNLNINKIFGDAVIETSTAGSGNSSWNSSRSYFLGIDGGTHYSFFIRGGVYRATLRESIFEFDVDQGSNSYCGFRICMAVG